MGKIRNKTKIQNKTKKTIPPPPKKKKKKKKKIQQKSIIVIMIYDFDCVLFQVKGSFKALPTHFTERDTNLEIKARIIIYIYIYIYICSEYIQLCLST